jgi:hypothetical protein
MLEALNIYNISLKLYTLDTYDAEDEFGVSIKQKLARGQERTSFRFFANKFD